MNEDIFEREIKAGDFVVYGIRSGNSGGMRYGIVLESKTKFDGADFDDKRVLVMAHKQYAYKNEVTVSRPSPYNMIIVPPETFPEDIRKKLQDSFAISKVK